MSTKTKKEFQNPLSGDENMELCVRRQMGRDVPQAVANDICVNLSAVLGANALKEASDLVLVPAVFTAEGVHNGLFKPWESISNAAMTLIGVPFFVNQPGEHENGVVPPVDDPMTHHGLVVSVNKDEDRKRLTGIIGLFKPAYLKAKGFTLERVRFQEALVNSLQKGGRFAISVSYLARLARSPGVHANGAYAYVETKHVFNGVSIVPAGAEKTALMNGITEDSSVDVIANGFNADLDAPTAPSTEESIEPLNTSYEQSGTKAMDAEQLRSMSITRLGEMNPEVAKLVNAHAEKEKALSLSNSRVQELETQVKALQKDNEKTGKTLANILDPKKADEILANFDEVAPLAEKVRANAAEASEELQAYREKEEKVLATRIKTAKKALANRMTEDDIKAFEDPEDPEATALRLEKLANQLGAKRVSAPTDILAGANADEDEDDVLEDDEDSGEAVANAEYEALLHVYETPAPAAGLKSPAKAAKRRGGEA